VRTNRIRAAAAFSWLGLALASNARAVDLRDWGRKYETASERFLVLDSFNNEAVLDKETQLVWRRSAPSATSWIYALQNCHANGTGGRYGWRLPSFSELLSLVGTGGVLPAGHPFLNVTAQAYFWSSTDLYSNHDYAWTKPLLVHVISAKSKDSANAYLCVRGVGVADRG
jgi:Protein of unknown function (DUF1566)